MSETSVQFWFKLQSWDKIVLDPSLSTSTQTIFTLESPNRYENFWSIFLKSGELVVAPFGLNKLSDPTLLFPEFKR